MLMLVAPLLALRSHGCHAFSLLWDFFEHLALVQTDAMAFFELDTLHL